MSPSAPLFHHHNLMGFCDSSFRVLVKLSVPSDIIQHHFDSAQYQRTKVHVVDAGPFATYLICCLAKSDLPAAAIWCVCFFESECLSLSLSLSLAGLATCATKCRLDLIIPSYERHVHIHQYASLFCMFLEIIEGISAGILPKVIKHSTIQPEVHEAPCTSGY